MSNLWKQIKNIFSQHRESLTAKLEETIQPILEEPTEPVIKRIKRQVSCKKIQNLAKRAH